MACDPDFEYAKRLGHECFETTEGVYCTRCACYYRDMEEYFNCHSLLCHRDPPGAREPVY